jgi:WhiB family redox-sensing transcriptional regulator
MGRRRMIELPTVPDWYADAVCAQTDPELFFPDKGGTNTQAKTICATCPAINDCLAYALTDPETITGIWGGTSQHERKAMRARKDHP